METIIYLSLIPVILFVCHQLYNYKNGIKFDAKVHVVPFVVALVVVVAGYGIGFWAEVADTEIRNGIVTSKVKERVSCSHSYACHCGKNGCSTCYEHLNDWDWVVHTNIPYDFTIDRIDRRGSDEPPRWTSVKVGDPVSDSFSYVNYVKGSKHSLYNKNISSMALLDKVPEYPAHVHDYYHVDRVIGVGVPVDHAWNHKLQATLSRLGPQYQINAIVILTTYGELFDAALEAKWLGAKKNDAVIIIHVDNGNDKNIQSVYVSSWTDKNIFKIELRDAIYDLKVFDMDAVMTTFSSQVAKNWKRKSMKDFSYLTSGIEIELWIIVLTLLVSIFVYGGVYVYMENRYGSGYRNSRSSVYRRRFL